MSDEHRATKWLAVAAAVVAALLAWRFLSYYADMRDFKVSRGNLSDRHLASTRLLWMVGVVTTLIAAALAAKWSRRLSAGAVASLACLAVSIWLTPMRFGQGPDPVMEAIDHGHRVLYAGVLASAAAAILIVASAIGTRTTRSAT